MEVFAALKPVVVWKYFSKILTLPRPSKHEEKIIAYLIDFAADHKLECKQDSSGNVLISKPASPGYELKEMLVLQSHLDMVCESNSDIQFDFFNEPIEAYIEEGWVKAKDTTLGADNGIGIATQLAIFLIRM